MIMAKADWLSVDPISGVGNAVISNSGSEHTGRIDRETIVTGKYAGGSEIKTYSVVQLHKSEFITIDELTSQIVNTGGSIVLTGLSNSPLLLVTTSDGITINELDVNGITVQNGEEIIGDPGASNQYSWSLKVSVSENPTSNQRSLSISVQGSSQSVLDTIDIVQEASEIVYEFEPYASIDNLPAFGGISTILAKLTKYRNGLLIYSQDVEPILSGSSDGFSISGNTVTAASRGTVVGDSRSILILCSYSFEGQSLSGTITVFQQENSILSESISQFEVIQGEIGSYELPADPDQLSLDVYCTISKTYSSGSSEPVVDPSFYKDNLQIVANDGSWDYYTSDWGWTDKGCRFYIDMDENTGTSGRSDVFTVTYDSAISGILTRQLSVYQAGKHYTMFVNSDVSYKFPFYGGEHIIQGVTNDKKFAFGWQNSLPSIYSRLKIYASVVGGEEKEIPNGEIIQNAIASQADLFDRRYSNKDLSIRVVCGKNESNSAQIGTYYGFAFVGWGDTLGTVSGPSEAYQTSGGVRINFTQDFPPTQESFSPVIPGGIFQFENDGTETVIEETILCKDFVYIDLTEISWYEELLQVLSIEVSVNGSDYSPVDYESEGVTVSYGTSGWNQVIFRMTVKANWGEVKTSNGFLISTGDSDEHFTINVGENYLTVSPSVINIESLGSSKNIEVDTNESWTVE